MPPPPPSASYLWNLDDFDTSSEDENVLENNDQQEEDLSVPIQAVTTSKSIESFDTRNNSITVIQNDGEEIKHTVVDTDDEENHEDDDEQGVVEGSSPTTVLTKPPKRFKKKRGKRKKKKKKTFGGSRRVSFGEVRVQEFERCMGTDVVPGDGGWPLGMQLIADDECTASRITVEEYENAKQERLETRWRAIQEKAQQKGTKKETSKHPKEEDEKRLPILSTPLETRQWDFHDHIRNPLFQKLKETERMKLFLSTDTNNDDELFTDPSDTQKTETSSESSRGCQLSRSRSGSISSSDGQLHRSRSGSATTEQYNDKFTQFDVHHLRNELEELRTFRSMEGAMGCTCKKLQVYLLPPNAGKKAHHKRMKLPKVKEELRKRDRLPINENTMSRDELELLLYDLVEAEPCCTNHDCPCAQNAIVCQADACSCWHTSHLTLQQQKILDSDTITLADIRTRCGNRFGMYTVDLDAINNYRRNFLSSLTTCQPVGMLNTTAPDGVILEQV